ncbi:putative methyltransferase AN0656, partial [Tetrabaena socialis]
PQQFVRDLVLRRCFEGRVLDAGCGIGDNALYLAKACPAAEVTAVDVVPRCLEFAAAKANLRGIRGKVHLLVADLLEEDLDKLPAQLGAEVSGSFSVVLDSATFHCLSDADRERYVPMLHRLLRPGGRIYMTCMSEEETSPGGPRRIPVADLESVFNPASGWEVESIEATVIEVHPAFWSGKAKARLFTIRKL